MNKKFTCPAILALAGLILGSLLPLSAYADGSFDATLVVYKIKNTD
jgi:hypothetical protein